MIVDVITWIVGFWVLCLIYVLLTLKDASSSPQLTFIVMRYVLWPVFFIGTIAYLKCQEVYKKLKHK